MPSTDSYYILTESQLAVVGLCRGRGNSAQVRAEIQIITQVSCALRVVANPHCPYDHFGLLTRPAKVGVWARKSLKRGANPVEELSKVH